MAAPKEPFDPNKHTWHPSVLPGQIVIVSTIDGNGQPNLAPKSWVTMAAFEGPVLAFGCNTEHSTYKNIVATRNYVVNIPNGSLAERIWALPHSFGAERVRRSGFTLVSAAEVTAPAVAECVAHLECVLQAVQSFGTEVMIFGRIVAASIDPALRRGAASEQYARLRPIFFLEERTYGIIDCSRQVGGVVPVVQDWFLVEVEPEEGGYTLTENRAEVAYWHHLWERGILLMAGALDSRVV